MKNIPFLLIYSRILIAILIAGIAYFDIENKAIIIVILMIIGLLTDVFDGIIARKLNVASEKLRVWDSNVDVFFWLIVIAAIFLMNTSFVKDHIWAILSIGILEIAAYIISLLKFKKTIATHSYLAKFWTITLLAFLIDLALNGHSGWIFMACLIVGIISRIEIILIILRLKEWTTDVASIFEVTHINEK